MASVIETFLLIFESDASKAQTGMSEAEKGADTLKKKVDQADQSTNKLGGSFLTMAKYAVGALAAGFSFAALSNSVRAAADYADYLDESSEALGVNIEDLSAWSDAAKLTGGSAQSFIGTLGNLSSAMAQMDATGKSRLAPFFKELGINMMDASGKMKEPFSMLLEISDAFEGMSKQESLGFGKKMGLDTGTIMLLQQGRRSLEDLIKRQKELGVVSKEDGERAAKFKDQLDDTSHAFRSIAMTIGGIVLPPLTEFFQILEKLFTWVSKNKHEFQAFGIAAGIVGGIILATYVPAMIAAAIATIAATWPLLLLVAAFSAVAAALFVVIEDILAFTKGYDSLIGTVLDRNPALVAAFNSVVDVVKDVIKWISEAYDKVVEFFSTDFSFSGMGDSIKASLGIASSSPLNSQTSGSIMNTTGGNRSVMVGEVNIQTQATDASGIASDIGNSLKGQMQQTLFTYDDGMAY